MKRRNPINGDDIRAVANFLHLESPLSGYLAGIPHGGAVVQRLEEMWCRKFNRRHAICVNSATSGLLAACEALLSETDTVAVPALSMSATAAVPLYCGANLCFTDVDEFGCMSPGPENYGMRFIATTLFGCPVDGYPTILDNAQGVGARIGDKWAEEAAEISVTSFNVHKQINGGEGGVITTDDDDLAAEMRGFINHGECGALQNSNGIRVGLNLRMTELTAVLVLSQLYRIEETLFDLESLTHRLNEAMPSAFTPLGLRDNCRSANYCYAFEVPADKRDAIIEYLNAQVVPAIPMYKPLYELPAFSRLDRPACQSAERISNRCVVFELCAWEYENSLSEVARALQEATKL